MGLPCLMTETFLRSDPHAVTSREEIADGFLSLAGFRGGLRTVLRHINTSLALGLSRSDLDRMTYERYAQEFLPLDTHASNPELRFGHWIRTSLDLGFKDIRVLTSQDDPLNRGLNLRNQIPLPESQIIILPSGGHLGYRAARASSSGLWIDRFLDSIYSREGR